MFLEGHTQKGKWREIEKAHCHLNRRGKMEWMWLCVNSWLCDYAFMYFLSCLVFLEGLLCWLLCIR